MYRLRRTPRARDDESGPGALSAALPGLTRTGRVPSVFISYSRRDGAFASRLHDALAERGYDVWIDREDIPPSAKWFDEIRAGVAGADGVVFVISPDSAASEVCVRELELATDLGKRIVPAVCREPDGVAVPEAAASLNWVFLRDSDDFAEGVATLTRALETDLDHVRTHTRLGVAAGRWEASGRDQSQLLRGAELTAAENWLVSAGRETAAADLGAPGVRAREPHRRDAAAARDRRRGLGRARGGDRARRDRARAALDGDPRAQRRHGPVPRRGRAVESRFRPGAQRAARRARRADRAGEHVDRGSAPGARELARVRDVHLPERDRDARHGLEP